MPMHAHQTAARRGRRPRGAGNYAWEANVGREVFEVSLCAIVAIVPAEVATGALGVLPRANATYDTINLYQPIIAQLFPKN
jgi:hypothetical protein